MRPNTRLLFQLSYFDVLTRALCAVYHAKCSNYGARRVYYTTESNVLFFPIHL